MFSSGDVVVYSATGVCRIDEICEKCFGGEKRQYYVLTPLMQKSSTVFIPVNNEELTRKMHPVLTKNKFYGLFSSISKLCPVRPENENMRREKFVDILDSGNREALILMVSDLRLYKKQQQESGRRLHLAYERLLNDAENLLFEEIAYVFEIERDSAEDFFISHLCLK